MHISTSTIALITAAAGITPFLTALIARPNMPRWLRVVLALVVAVLTSLAAVVADPNTDLTNTAGLISAVVAVITMSQVAYNNLFKTPAEKLEAATSPGVTDLAQYRQVKRSAAQ